MKIKLLAYLLFASLAGFAQTVEVLTNSDIAKLTKLDLPAAAIISKIRNSKTHFDVGTDALIELKKQGIATEVMTEMISSSSGEQKTAANQKDMSDPKTMRSTGIYYYSKKNPAALFTQVNPTVISNTKSGGFGTAVAQHYTLGLAKGKEKSALSGANSRLQIKQSRPTFYFYFSAQTNQTSINQWWFATATSPNEFDLIRLNEKNDSRAMVVGSSNAYGSSTGVSKKQKIDFDYEQVAEGIYKVKPKDYLDPGEYCFIYTGSTPTQHSNDKVFDFGISPEEAK